MNDDNEITKSNAQLFDIVTGARIIKFASHFDETETKIQKYKNETKHCELKME